MAGTVIVLSGAIGTRRSAISIEVAKSLGWGRVKFSDFLKSQIEEDGLDPNDRRLLQKVGQSLVQTDIDRFIAGVLALAETWEPGQNLIVDGLRHAEVRLALSEKVEPSALYHVHVEVDEVTRQETAEKVGRIHERVLYRYDQDLTEAQIPKILPAYADDIVDGSLPLSIVAQKIASRVRMFSNT